MDWNILFTIIIVFLLGLTFWLYRIFVRRSYGYRAGPDEIHYVEVAPGWRLALSRYRPEKIKTGRLPLLMLHGFGVNRHSFDASPDISLARYMARKGFDVWVLEFRGHGLSSTPSLYNNLKYDFAFDEFHFQDLPRAIDRILMVTRQKKVNLLGHSLGGLAILAYLARPRGERLIHRTLCMATPVRFTTQRPVIRAVKLLAFISRAGAIPLRKLAYFILPFAGLAEDSLTRAMIYGKNLSRAELKAYLLNHSSDISPALTAQMVDWFRRGYIADKRGQDILEGLERIKTPILFLNGSKDGAAPAEIVQEFLAERGPQKAVFQLCGRDSGFQNDFGHGDIVSTRPARDEIFPLVESWFAARR